MKVERFNLIFRIQHFLMFLSVLFLIATGFLMSSFRNFDDYFLNSITNYIGGIDKIRKIHHFFGYLLTFSFSYLLLYIFVHPEGRRDFLLFLPTKKDFKDFYHNIAHFLGKKEKPPEFGRFSYWEKFDFWAAFWGCIIMIGSGIIMLFPEKFSNIFVGNKLQVVYEVAIEAHYHEAILAALALLIWHLYNVHLKPKKFPGSLLWFDGKIKAEEKIKEHPLEDKELNLFGR